MAPTPTTRIEAPSGAAFGRRRFGVWSPGILIGLLRVVGQRLWSHLALMLAIAAGFTVAIALVVSIPVYAEAVGYRILRDELSRDESGARRPPFAFMYRYLGSQTGVIGVGDYARLDEYLQGPVDRLLGLPVRQRVRYVSSDKLPMLPAGGVGDPLIWVNMAFASDFEQHIEVVDGALPQVAAEGPVEVLIAEELAARLGLQVGEEYTLLGPRTIQAQGQQPGEETTQSAREQAAMSLPIRIAGVWRAKNPEEDYWFYQPETLNEALFVPERSFTERLAAKNPKSVYVALWYLLADGSRIRSADVQSVSARIARSATEVSTLLSGTRLDISPARALSRHQEQVQRLTLILTVFSIPVLGLIAYFIILVAGLVVQRQSNEISVLRSRGASRAQVLGIYLLEWLLLGALALGLGVALGQLAAFLMTWTRSFLDVEVREWLPIGMTPDAWQRAWQVLGLLLVASLLPAFAAARYTIVSFKAERARATRKPWWQRAYLDVLLLVPVFYGYSQLSQRGTIAFLGFGVAAGDPFGNPLLLLAPSLFIFSLALVANRIFPLLMALLAWVTNRLPGVATVTALRYLARTPAAYTGPVLLLVLTLSLATFTASMARTLDNHLYDQIYYEHGGDMRLYDLGWSTEAPGGPMGAIGQPAAGATQEPDKLDEARFVFLPVTDYLLVPGVTAATRVSTSQVDISAGGRSTAGRFVGVDRVDLLQVIHWRSDYARESLGALMNRLADDPSSVLVSSNFAAQTGLRVGDRFVARMNDLDVSREVPFTVAGYVRLFPTIYPGDGPFIIGNLDYVHEQQGGQYPYDVWLRLAPDADRKQISVGLAELGLKTFERGFAPEEIAAERERPERQGFYGLLSVGFIASAFLTVLGFLFYSVLSFQRRFVELGMLRAIGLSTRQLGALLAWEQALIIGTGMIAGTLIGVSASQLFIPFLQVRRGEHSQIPPFLVEIAWNQIGIIYATFGAMLVIAVVVMVFLLRRMKLFQAVKLGEAI
ncbi:MAG TPA: FtsX-like permease family protein [Roseiflexaceae bacterium]|nr:FtsX-like permease family protein [Roseiflexaceae bacterium]